jgi:hypothetical protein
MGTMPRTTSVRSMSAERLRELITLSLGEHPEVVAVRPTQTIYMDRTALSIEDAAGLHWRVWISRQPREATQ